MAKCGHTRGELLLLLLLFGPWTWPSLPHSVLGHSADDGDATHDAEHRLRIDLGLTDDGNKSLTHVLPPYNKTSPVTVKIGMSLLYISDLDAKAQILTSGCWFKLTWSDSRLKWDSGKYEGITILRVAAHQVWKPDIRLYNAAKMWEVNTGGDVMALLHDFGEVTWIPPSVIHTLCPVNIRRYPYDEHTCNIKLGSWTFSGHHIDTVLYGENDTVDLSDLTDDAGQWQVVDSSAKRSVTRYACCEEPYTDVTFQLRLRRRSPLHRLTVVGPVLTATTLVLASFWLPPYAYERVTTNCLGLLIYVLVLLHLSAQVPSVGDNAPIIVSICGHLTLLATAATVASIVCLCVLRGRRGPPPRWMHQVLGSRLAGLLCLGTPAQSSSDLLDAGRTELDVEGSSHLVEAEFQHRMDHQIWIQFFKLVDRVTFIVVAVVTVVVLAAAA